MVSRNIIVLTAAVAASLAAFASILLTTLGDKEGDAGDKARLDQLAEQGEKLAENQADNENKAVEGEVYYDDDELDMEAADRDNLTPEELAELPEWAREFSKLGKEARAQFMLSFSIAKAAYSRESWAECVALCNECEVIFDGNPNLWNLRACALIELKAIDEAETYVNRSLAYQADDPIGMLNLANIQMARQEFEACIRTLQALRHDIRPTNNPDQLDIFTFRQLLCHLMLRQEMEARDLVADINALHDSPLFYCAEAAFAIYRNDSDAARRALDSASRIYGRSPLLQAYRKWLEDCGLRDKYMGGRDTESLL